MSAEQRIHQSEVPNRSGTYLLTWTTYGTWLPGHERGFVGRIQRLDGTHRARNRVGEAQDRGVPDLIDYAKQVMRGERVVLNRMHAAHCASELDEVGSRHGFVVWVASIMATHLHVIAKSDHHDGAKLLQLLKGNLSYSLTARFGRPDAPTWWTRHGSRRLLPNSFARECGTKYVLAQEHPLIVLRADRHRVYKNESRGGRDHAG